MSKKLIILKLHFLQKTKILSKFMSKSEVVSYSKGASRYVWVCAYYS